jgi:acetyl esterase/lipase
MIRSFTLSLLFVIGCDSRTASVQSTSVRKPAGAASVVGPSANVVSSNDAAVTLPSSKNPTQRDLRKSFQTKTIKARGPLAAPPPIPPPDARLERIKYRAPVGEMWAYVSPDPKDGKKHPAVVWAAGGFDFSVGASFFEKGPIENDQSGARLRTDGIVVLFPSYRGTHDNPGSFEMIYGEVEDYLASVDHVRGLSYVDSDRIFLAGHSTGGTLVLIAAALTDKYRAAFCFGPVKSADRYDAAYASFDRSSRTEWDMRSPLLYVSDIKRPTFIIEGNLSPNADDVTQLHAAASKAGAPLKASLLIGKNHFDVLAPTLESIAKAIANDDPKTAFDWRP